jgi:endonuclease-8
MLMSGSWHIYRHGERWQQPRTNMRIVIENSDFVAVGFRVPVAADAHCAVANARPQHSPLPPIDVLSPELRPAEAACATRARARREEIGDVLLHQEVLAGVGNVFKSEVCFVTGINPFCRWPRSARAGRRFWLPPRKNLSPPMFLRIPATPS